MSEEARNMIYLVINIITATIILGAMVAVMGTKNDYAEDRYNEQFAEQRAQMRREFASYDDCDLKGIEVVVLIRNQYNNGEIDIYVDKDKYNNWFKLDGITRNVDITTAVNRAKISPSFNINRTDYASTTGVQMVRSNDYMFAASVIRTLFNDTDIYHAELVYDGADVASGATGYNENSIVTGIYIYKK